MGESTSRRPPPDARETGEARKAANAESEQESQQQPEAPPAAGPAKKQEPQSKFHGNDPRRH